MSRQDYATPREFTDAVQRRFGLIVHDLCADAANAVVASHYDEAADALAQDWRTLPAGVLWCNPPFRDIEPWAFLARCCAGNGRVIALLTPASIGTAWFAEHVHRHALVLGLSPRLTFVGCTAPYPKDLMLSIFSGVAPGFECWRWDA